MGTHHHGATGAPDLGAQLHARGLRMTTQRERVLAAVRELGHATPEQIFEMIDGVDLTTVYRTLELLEQIGMVRHTHLDHGAPAYRPAEDDHVHVICHDCGDVVDAPAELADTLERRLRDERGFHLDRAHLTVFGRCRRCTEAQAEQTLDTRR